MLKQIAKKLSPLVLWMDTAAGQEVAMGPEAYKVDWLRLTPFWILHLMCLGVFWVGWSWPAVATALALYVIRMFAITGWYHRYFAHRTFKTGRLVQFLFAFLGNSSSQRSALWWAAHHRHHHRFSDRPEDPHSPARHGFWVSHMLWFTFRANYRTRTELIRDFAKYPELRLLDRWDALAPVTLGVAMYGFGACLRHFLPGSGVTGAQMLIWGFFVSTVLLFHGTFTINSLAHVFGRRRFPTEDDSRNNFLLALITLGEGWHNNHHHYPNTVRQGFYWWEVDMTYYALWAMSKLGLVWDLKPLPKRVLERNPELAAAPATVFKPAAAA